MDRPHHTVQGNGKPLPPIAPEIEQFFHEKLPADDGNRHTLVLGEYHDEVEHLDWLREQLPRLKREHALTTLGIEKNGDLNVLFMAYADGRLQKELGEEAARDYFRNLFIIGFEVGTKENAIAQADLIMAAMDLGIRVVAYDSRRQFPEEEADQCMQFCSLASKELQGVSIHASDALARLRRLHEDVIYHYAKRAYEKPPYFSSAYPPECFVEEAWRVNEIKWLCGLDPSYQKTFSAIEAGIGEVHRQIKAKRTHSDATSACLYNALAAPQGNGITLVGFNHINGMGAAPKYGPTGDLNDPDICHIYGTLPQHIFSTGQSAESHRPHCVHAGVIAGIKMAGRFKDNYQARLETAETVIPNEISLIAIADQTVEPLAQPKAGDARIQTMKEKFSAYDTQRAEKWLNNTEALQKRMEKVAKTRINPLLIPSLRHAMDAIREAVNLVPQAGVMR